ncbi:MAG: hypothetical protein GX797_00640 [Chloroflexi bacterium]|jgi:PhnB protein|nr:hypothetical protein [Chloroflexota bacterium]
MSERVDIYLHFKDNAAEAAKFYSEVFDKKAAVMKYAEFPESDKMEGIDLDKVGHAEITFDNLNLMFSDVPGMEITLSNNFSISWWTDEEARFHKIWKRFVEGGSTVHEETMQTFFATLYGRIEDPFGISWLLMYNHQDEQEG